MRSSSPLRTVSLLAASGLVAALVTVTAPAANAAPVFVNADTYLDPYSDAYITSGACVDNFTTTPDPDVPVVENGPVASATTTTNGTSANGGDTVAIHSTATSKGSVKSAGGNPTALDFETSGSVDMDFALPASSCNFYTYAGADLDFSFTVTHAGYLHFDFRGAADSYSEVYFYKLPSTGDYPYYDHYGHGWKFRGSDSVYLPAGSYEGYYEGYVYNDYSNTGNVDTHLAGSTSVHATFEVAGSQTEAVSGKGKKYVKLPGARSCATHTLTPTITGKKKRANQVKQVTFFVNDHKVKKVKTPDKGDAINLVLADDDPADVVAAVKLFPKKKGRPGKVLEVSASYEAC